LPLADQVLTDAEHGLNGRRRRAFKEQLGQVGAVDRLDARNGSGSRVRDEALDLHALRSVDVLVRADGRHDGVVKLDRLLEVGGDAGAFRALQARARGGHQRRALHLGNGGVVHGRFVVVVRPLGAAEDFRRLNSTFNHDVIAATVCTASCKQRSVRVRVDPGSVRTGRLDERLFGALQLSGHLRQARVEEWSALDLCEVVQVERFQEYVAFDEAIGARGERRVHWRVVECRRARRRTGSRTIGVRQFNRLSKGEQRPRTVRNKHRLTAV
jgi:hypothetical protein